MSLINHNNQTNDSTKNDLYNSYEVIRKTNLFDEKLKKDLLPTKDQIKNKFIQNNLNEYSNNSKNYCLTTSNLFRLNKNNIIPISNSNSFNLFNHPPKYSKIKNTKKILSSHIKIIKQRLLSIKEKNAKNSKTNIYNDLKQKTNYKNYFKTDIKKLSLFKNKNNNNDIINNSQNKVKLKELKFKVFRIIENNYIPLCQNFVSKAENINNKILEYYTSNNYKKSLKVYNNNIHYKLDMEANPKINKYVNITKINDESSFTKKLNLDKLFSKEEKKIILSEPDYYFKHTNKDCFENVNIIKTKKLVEKINKEDMIQEELDKKNKKRSKTTNNNIEKNDNNILNKTEININRYRSNYNYMDEYRNNKKLMEKLIKKEEKKEKEKKVLFLEEAFDKEIKNGYYRYKNLINKYRKSHYKKRKKLMINNTDAMITKKNLIINNYKKLLKYERIVEKYNKINDKEISSNGFYKSSNKYNLKDISNNKEDKIIKVLVNKIKGIYKK